MPPPPGQPAVAAVRDRLAADLGDRALNEVDPQMAVNIEHEDVELDRLDGVRFAMRTLLEAAQAL